MWTHLTACLRQRRDLSCSDRNCSGSSADTVYSGICRGGCDRTWYGHAPVIGIIAGVVAAIGIIIAIIQNWGAITEWFGNLWTSICNGVESVWSSVSSFLSSTLDGIISFIKNGFNSIKSTITNVMDSIENTIISIWTAIYENPIVQDNRRDCGRIVYRIEKYTEFHLD